MKSSDTIRIFFAAEIPTDVQHRLASKTTEMKVALNRSRLSWTKPGSIHLTLKFFGDVSKQNVSKIMAVIDALRDRPPMESVIDHAGVFPNVRKPAVLWAGFEKNERWVELYEESARRFDEIGYPEEKRSFHPHLTLARVREFRDTPSELEAAINKIILREPVRTDTLTLFRSELRPGGSVYTPLHSVRLERA